MSYQTTSLMCFMIAAMALCACSGNDDDDDVNVKQWDNYFIVGRWYAYEAGEEDVDGIWTFKSDNTGTIEWFAQGRPVRTDKISYELRGKILKINIEDYANISLVCDITMVSDTKFTLTDDNISLMFVRHDGEEDDITAQTDKPYDGTWKGDMYVSYYFDYYDQYFDASCSVICFLENPDKDTSGNGYWIDYFDHSGWKYNYIANHITWTVDNGIIKIHFIEDDAYVRIRDYSFNDTYFSGSLELESGNWQRFSLRHASSPDWGSFYWGYSSTNYQDNHSNENKMGMDKAKAKNPEASMSSDTPKRIFRLEGQ